MGPSRAAPTAGSPSPCRRGGGLEARRLSRLLKDPLHIREKIGQTGAGFRSLTEQVDTTTPAGRMMMQMVGAFAEFERAMIRERTSAGLAAARAEGRIGGRRKKLDENKPREIAEAAMSGRRTAAQMARMFGVSAPTVSRIVAAHVAAGAPLGSHRTQRRPTEPAGLQRT
jgi:DNA invertase Pin-like site-specific DNA recombinase